MIYLKALCFGFVTVIICNSSVIHAGTRVVRSPQFGGSFSQANAQAGSGGFGGGGFGSPLPPRPLGGARFGLGGFGGNRPGVGGQGGFGGRGGSISISKSISISRGGASGAQSSSSAGGFGK